LGIKDPQCGCALRKQEDQSRISGTSLSSVVVRNHRLVQVVAFYAGIFAPPGALVLCLSPGTYIGFQTLPTWALETSGWRHKNVIPVSSKPYVYDQIPHNHIRLLKTTAVEPRIVCSLEIYPLEDAPPFHAVSYAWGDANVTHIAILCDGRELLVTPHLHEGLRCLIISARPEFLWIDAICINQQNDIEKAHQVTPMHTIFKTAAEVLVWLGAADETSGLAMGTISRLHKLMDTLSDHFNDYPATFAQHGLAPPDDGAWSAINKLLNRSWMGRLWVMQGVVLAKQLSVFCGFNGMKWDDFAEFCVKYKGLREVFNSNFPRDNLFDEMMRRFDNGSVVVVGIEGLREGHLSNRPFDFMSYVEIARYKSCQNPVDHIYGLLGFAEGRDGIFREGIPIDYSPEAIAQYWKIFALYGKIGISLRPGLRLLGSTSSKIRPEGLPSWCPNLTCQGDTFRMPIEYRAWPLPDSKASIYDMKEHIKTRPDNGGAIEIDGAQIDTVDYVLPSVFCGEPPHPPLIDSCHLKWFDNCLYKTRAVTRPARTGYQTPSGVP
jgi:Heterokaryon incompatibility protein (HET)